MVAMRAKRSLMLVLGALLVQAGCVEGGELSGTGSMGAGEEVIAPLESLDTLVAEAPGNGNLPEEGKADATYPAKFTDLVAYQSPVRNQGGRGVCSIFSTVALMEHLYILEGSRPTPDFSEQYLQWSAKFQANSFRNTSGSNPNDNLRAVSTWGIVDESDWPYESFTWGTTQHEECTGEEEKRPTFCWTNGEPPQAAVEAQKWKLPSGRWVSTRARDLKAHMTNRRTAAVISGTFFYQAWNHRASTLPTNNEYWRKGYVLYPNDEDRQKSLEKRVGHSVLVVGWDDTLEVPRVDGKGEVMRDAQGNVITEKGFFIFKNSWGTGSFGTEHPSGTGYGYISQRYVQEFMAGYISDVPVIAPEPVCGQTLACTDARCANDPACPAQPAQGQSSYAESDPNAAIPDNSATGLTDVIEMRESGRVGDVTVSLFIEHPFVGDLRVELIHPDGTVHTLLTADGRAGRDIVQDFVVRAFAGKPAQGAWKLVVRDAAQLDSGTLVSWGLKVNRQ